MAVESLVRELTPLPRAQRAPIRFGARWRFALFVSDLLMLAVATVAAFSVVQRDLYVALSKERVLPTALFCIAAWLLLFYRVGLYRRSFAISIRDELYCVFTALLLGAAPPLLAFTIIPSISSSRLVLLLSLAFAMLTVGASRSCAHELHAALVRRRPKRIVVAGRTERVDAAIAQLNTSENSEVLRLDIDDVSGSLASIDALSTRAFSDVEWLRHVRELRCDMLLLTEMLPPSALPALLRIAAFERFTVAFAPPRFCAQAYELRLETEGHQALIVPRQLYVAGHGARILKRAVDLVIAASALVVAAPIMLCAALAIVVEDRGPVFFRQERVGLLGAHFNVLKFRSMRVDAERGIGAIWSPIDDRRTTRVGRFLRRTSIDELPQLFNVLNGDMSIVGPRPERPVFVERFRRALPRYDERHLVRPGITGWAQVNMARKLDPSQAGEKLSHDLWYIEHWGLFLDCSIVFKTAAEVLFHRA